MGQGFGNNGFGNRKERQRMLFVASAGLAFSLLVIMLVVLNYQSDVSAGGVIKSSETLIPDLGSIKIWVADVPVKRGDKLSDVPFRQVSWPRNTVPAGAILDRSEAKDMYAKMALPANSPIERINLTNQPIQDTLPVTPGNRAVTIDVNATSSNEGLTLPGTRVDVVLTAMVDKNISSQLIVQNARVLAAGGDTKTQSERGNLDRQGGQGNSQIRTVTLDVSVQEALKINTARQMGSLNLLMRGGGDDKIAINEPIDGKDFEDKNLQKNSKTKCVKGHVRVEGKGEMQINCDGSWTSLESSAVH